MKDPESSPLLALDSDRWAEILAGALKADVERSSNGVLLATFRRGPFRLAYPEFPVGRPDYPISTVEALCEMAAARRATMIRFHSDERLPSRPAIAPIALGTSRIDDLQSWNESSCKKARRTRNRHLKSPLRIEPAAERDGPMLFELYRLVIERHGGRAKYNAAYFDAIAAESTLVARNDRKIVGFVTIARLGKRAYYLHGAHDPLARSLYPSDLLFRSMILRARSEGAESFDFLPSPAGQPSLRRYKQDWGGAPAPLHVTDVPLRPVLGQVLKLGLRAQGFLSGR